MAVCVLFVCAQISVAEESFQNNLLKMDVSQSSLGGVKMTLYTNKPYSENVVVNKKSDTEYVILMPETSNSMTAAPVLNSVAGVVRGVSVKTQQYDNQNKGYTKITVSTTKPIEINPQVQTLKSDDVKLSQKDYDELLEQVAKTKSAKTGTSKQKVAVAPIVKKQTPPVFRPAKILEKLRPTLKTASAPKLTKVHPAPVKYIPQEVKKVTQVPAPVAEPAKTSETVANTSTPEVAQTNQVQNVQTEPEAQSAVPQEVPAAMPLSDQPQESALNKYIGIIKNNLYLVLGFIAAAFLLLLLGARAMTKNINKQKENFTEHLQDQPPVMTDYSEKINEDMTWKEKFQTYVDTNQQGALKEAPETKSENQELDDLFSTEPSSESEEDAFGFIGDSESDGAVFDEEIFNDEIYDEVGEEYYEEQQVSAPVEEEQQNQDFSSLDGFGKIEYDNEDEDEFSLDDLLSEDEDELSVAMSAPMVLAEEEPVVSEVPISSEDFLDEISSVEEVVEEEQQGEQGEFVKSEYVIDEGKGFYLVDFEDTSALVGHIEDEIFVLKRFEQRLNEKIQARLDEKKANSSNYMTRVGNFKGLVEVTPEKMNLLIEL